MEKESEPKWKKVSDNILIYNLYILIIGFLYLAFSLVLSVNGNYYFYSLFQKLWYPLFIPSLSLFFTSILVEAVINALDDRKNI